MTVPQDTSDDTDRFLQAVAAFSAAPEPVSPMGRKIATSSEAGVAAVLTEVNETVMRRVLHFSSSDKEHLALEVSERRIRRLVSLDDAFVSGQAQLIDKPLSAEDAAAVLSMLKSVTSSCDVLYVRARLAPPGTKSSIEGLSIAELCAGLIVLAAEGAMTPVVLSTIVAICADAVASRVQHAESAPVRQGNAQTLTTLDRLASTDGCLPKSGSCAGLWFLGDETGHAVLHARLDDTTLICALPMEQALRHFDVLKTMC